MEEQLFFIFIFFIVCIILGGAVLLFRAMRLRNIFLYGSESDKQCLEQGLFYLEKVYNMLLSHIERNQVDSKEGDFFELKKTREFVEKNYLELKEQVETVKQKIADLDAITSDLRTSMLESSQEMEMLRTQENGLRDKTSELKKELDKVLKKCDQLMIDFSSSQDLVQALKKAKAEALESQDKIFWYQEKITEINMNYMQLKRVYDALDIEYTQLYERSNSEENNDVM
jgi:chromosome segregation ATPase